jgi:DNA-binding transcriptional regulator LsrR (DeoR family)
MIRAPSRAERTIIKHVARQVLASGLTERQIAKKARWHEKKVRRLLTGDTELGAVEMQALARVLRRPVGELFPPEQRRAA